MKKYIFVFMISLFYVLSIKAGAYPDLKYANAGTFPLWTEESYYSSPEVCDLDGDGNSEIIFSNYSITVLDGKTGKTKWKVNSGYDRNTPVEEFGLNDGNTWCDVEIYDIDGNGTMEIITGHGGGMVSVLDSNGYFMPGWPKKPIECSVKSTEVADLDGDGKKEIVVGYALEGNTSIYVFNYDGTIRRGWPQTRGENGTESWTYGVFMDTMAIADLNYDGYKEIIVPSDLSYVSVFEHDGSSFMANQTVFENKSWGQVALFEDYSAEIISENRGWGFEVKGHEIREQLYKGEFGHAKAAVDDLDGNGSKEVVVTTIMCNRKYFIPSYPPTEYMTVAIFNADRTRYKNEQLGYNWEVLPTDLGEPLVQNPDTMCSYVFQCPTISDIDGDGEKEILFNSYNGKVHCFGLNKKEPYAWPFSLTKRTSPEFEYASPVVCKDIDYDGKQEIIFVSYYDESQNYTNVRGSLYILNYEGKLMYKAELPDSKEKGIFNNGSMACPLVVDVDDDGAYEVIINTLHGAICVYDL